MSARRAQYPSRILFSLIALALAGSGCMWDQLTDPSGPDDTVSSKHIGATPQNEDGSGSPPPGGTLNLVCPGTLPLGYQCVVSGANQAPARFNIPVLHGTWVERSFDVCMTLRPDGTSTFRYTSGAPPHNGRWGALVNRQGQFQPVTGPYFVFTGSDDPQIRALSFDENTGRFVGWGFTKSASCPW